MLPTLGRDDPIPVPPVLDKKEYTIPSDDAQINAPLSYDEPVVTRRELWSYCCFSLTLFQALSTAAGYDPVRGQGSSCLGVGASGKCVLPWGGGTKAVNSVVLIANGASFAIITIILTTISPAADYGSFGRWLLLGVTLISLGAQFSAMSLTRPGRWGASMAMYMTIFTTYGVTLALYTAIFPRLARHTRFSRDLRERYNRGEIPAEVYEEGESLERTRISNTITAMACVGGIVMLLLDLSLLLPLQGHADVNNYVIVMAAGYWVLTGTWWFIYQQPRPGPKLPKGERYIAIGWKRIWLALKQYKKLPYTFTYLFAYFLLADDVCIANMPSGHVQALSTTSTLVYICQNDRLNFSLLENTYLGITQLSTSFASQIVSWYAQRYWKIGPKKIFIVASIVATLVPLWGMMGIWTDKFGFHNVWEFWMYAVVFGFFQALYYSYSQTIMAELSPPGFDYMFFGLFGLSNRASSIIGPNVIQAIIDRTGNTWDGFSFLFGLCVAANLIIWLAVDVPKGRHDALRWAAGQRGTADGIYTRTGEKNEASVEGSGKS
ncbi:MFS general substrate transporter [Multifurca ochricompacta]|uniref:Autophagy-related protein n=1 Tax=Multifurca ochricompacta TaxID=376703 RepID=A0AAD4QPE9_9AGAM|nr:MFS general substrate transporter [Multifurca ochricompacta]